MTAKTVELQCEINDGWELFSGEAPSDEEADEWGQRRLDWLSRNMPPGMKRVDMSGEIQFVSL